MVTAVDHKPVIDIVPIEGTKTFEIICREGACDWMDTGGNQAAATRKKNKHRDEHLAAIHGAPGAPTIYDEIEGTAVVPEVDEPPIPVRDIDYFKRMKEEADAFNAKHADEPPEPCPWDCMIQHEHIGLSEEVPPGTPVVEMEIDSSSGPMTITLPAQEAVSELVSTHTRTKTDAGPDFCKECSDAISDWVPWPCDGAVEKGELPRTRLQLTHARLQIQKGPSDRNRDEWLAARAESISATAVAKLGMASDVDYAIEELLREALNGSTFTGNEYTEWGKQREPFLEDAGQRRHGIVGESHLYFARTNRRHSASPDGIRIHPDTGDVGLGEYKTCGKELTLQQVHAKGYYDQCQWQMHVLEASHVWLMWEWRFKGTDGRFYPEVGGEHLIMRDQERIDYLIELANRYLEALDAARDRVAPREAIDPRLKALVNGLLNARAVAARAEANLREYCDLNDLKSVDIPDLAKVSYTWGSPRTTFDSAAFRIDHPALYEEYLKEGKAPEKQTLRVKAKGESEDEE